MYFTMASSNWSPAILMEVDSTMPDREMTAMSVVPPPMSTIMWPSGLAMSMPASMTARSSTSVMPEGTQMTMRGLNSRKEVTLRMNSLSIRSVMS